MTRTSFVSFLFALVLCACADPPAHAPDGAPAPSDGAARDAPRGESTTIRFLHLNDLHAHLVPHADLVTTPEDGTPHVELRGGIARLATLIERERGAVPHSVLMNIGDTFHGGVEALFTNGDAIAAPLNALGVDLGVPGNWDFAYGPLVTRARYRPDLAPPIAPDAEAPSFPNLAANVIEQRSGEPFLPPTTTLRFGGVTVGFVGITSDIVPRMHPILATGLEFAEGYDAHLALVREHAGALRAAGADVVVVMSELGIHKDWRLANDVEPGLVDVFFSAHTHEVTWEPLVSRSGALVVEAGNDGYLGVMDVEVAGGRVLDRRWRLLTVTPELPDDPTVAALVDAARAPFLDPSLAAMPMELPSPISGYTLDRPIDTVIGHTDQPLHRRHPFESPFNDAFTDMQRAIAGTELAMTPGFRFDAVVAPEDEATAWGGVTIEQAFRFFPVVYTLATAQVTGTRLREIIEAELTAVFSPDAFAQSGGWAPGFGGLELELDLARPDGERVVSMRLAGSATPLGGSEVLDIAGCTRPFDDDGVLCSHGGFANVQPMSHPDGTAYTPIDLLVEGLATIDTAPRASVSDASGEPFWPEAVFVQPLEGVGGAAPSSATDAGAPAADAGTTMRRDGGFSFPRDGGRR